MPTYREDTPNSRHRMPPEFKEVRNALYKPGGPLPTVAEKNAVQAKISKQPGMAWYTLRQHQTWCSRKEQGLRPTRSRKAKGPVKSPLQPQLREQLIGRLGQSPDPTFHQLLLWEVELGVPFEILAKELKALLISPMPM